MNHWWSPLGSFRNFCWLQLPSLSLNLQDSWMMQFQFFCFTCFGIEGASALHSPFTTDPWWPVFIEWCAPENTIRNKVYAAHTLDIHPALNRTQHENELENEKPTGCSIWHESLWIQIYIWGQFPHLEENRLDLIAHHCSRSSRPTELWSSEYFTLPVLCSKWTKTFFSLDHSIHYRYPASMRGQWLFEWMH